MGFWLKFTREAQIRHQNKFLMDGWLLASPYGSYSSSAVLYHEASGSYGRWAMNLWPSTVTVWHVALQEVHMTHFLDGSLCRQCQQWKQSTGGAHDSLAKWNFMQAMLAMENQ